MNPPVGLDRNRQTIAVRIGRKAQPIPSDHDREAKRDNPERACHGLTKGEAAAACDDRVGLRSAWLGAVLRGSAAAVRMGMNVRP
jgi:hypothetical protein